MGCSWGGKGGRHQGWRSPLASPGAFLVAFQWVLAPRSISSWCRQCQRHRAVPFPQTHAAHLGSLAALQGSDSFHSREEPSPRKPNKANPTGRSGQQLRHHPATKETRPAHGAARLASPPVRLAFDRRCRRRGILLGSSQKRYSCIPATCSRAESASFVLGP